MRAYDALAVVYDRLLCGVDYAAYADFFERVCRRAGLSPELVLDLGCGTGNMTLELAKRGYDMTGVDGSAEMLSRAFARAGEAGQSGILFLEQDMRQFELYGTVDAAVSTLDCFNYLTTAEDLSRTLSLLHNYLIDGGLLLFDVNTPYKFRNVFAGREYVLEDEDGAFCGWQNDYDQQSRLCRFSLSVFLPDGKGKYTRRDEEQTERAWTRRELSAALAAAGFGEVEFWGDLDLTPPRGTTERWYVTARCKK